MPESQGQNYYPKAGGLDEALLRQSDLREKKEEARKNRREFKKSEKPIKKEGGIIGKNSVSAKKSFLAPGLAKTSKGTICMELGIALSLTFFGAIIGIPLFIIGVILKAIETADTAGKNLKKGSDLIKTFFRTMIFSILFQISTILAVVIFITILIYLFYSSYIPEWLQTGLEYVFDFLTL